MNPKIQRLADVDRIIHEPSRLMVVALLAAVTCDAAPEPPKRGQGEVLRDVQAIIKSMTAKNWRQKKASLLALFSGT